MNESSINSFLSVGQNGFAEFTHGSLFSGIGGFDLAAEWMGWTNIFHCEWNPFAQKILKQHFPNAITYGDITKTDFTIHRGTIDVLTGGFPCQPYSVAGKRKGKEDERHLWPEMLRAIREIVPRYVVGENVAGLVNWNGGMVFEEVQTDLENEGYEVQAFIFPACSIGAYHRRERVWFVAYANGNRLERNLPKPQTRFNIIGQNETVLQWFNRIPSPRICRGVDGLPNRVDRIKALGNAIVPQVALQIFRAIQIADRQEMEGEKTINTVNLVNTSIRSDAQP